MNNKSETVRSAGRRTSAEFNWSGFAFRLVATLVLVLATYNPSGWSYVHCLYCDVSDTAVSSAYVVVGIVVLIGWVILIILSVMLEIGLSWSHVRRRLTGQFEVDDD